MSTAAVGGTLGGMPSEIGEYFLRFEKVMKPSELERENLQFYLQCLKNRQFFVTLDKRL